MLADTQRSPQKHRNEKKKIPSFQVPVSFYCTCHLTLRCNRPLKTVIYMSLCSTASGKHPLFGPWEKWPPKIHFVPLNLRTTRIFLISWSFSTFLTPLSCGLWSSYFASFYSTVVSRKDRRETQGIRLSFHDERNKRNSRKIAFPSSTMSCSYRFYTANSFFTGMKEKLRDEKISLQIYCMSFGLTFYLYKKIESLALYKCNEKIYFCVRRTQSTRIFNVE